jgi:hypothetical protein
MVRMLAAVSPWGPLPTLVRTCRPEVVGSSSRALRMLEGTHRRMGVQLAKHPPKPNQVKHLFRKVMN